MKQAVICLLLNLVGARKYLMDGVNEIKSESRVEAENGCAHPTFKLKGTELVPDVGLPDPCRDICIFKDSAAN
jgi:hypothetical protein